MTSSSSLLRSVLILLILTSFTYAKQTKIACIGNSITRAGYPELLNYEMGTQFTVFNAGHGGATVISSAEPWFLYSEFDSVKVFKPDIIVLKLGTNDTKPLYWAYNYEFDSDYNYLLDTLTHLIPNVKIYLCLPTPILSNTYELNNTILDTGVIPRIRKIANSRNLPIIDLYAPFLNHPEYYLGGVHINLTGLNRISKIIATDLQKNYPVPTNIALNKKVVASGSCTSIEGVSNINDDNPTTKWCENRSGPKWAYVDLGKDYSITSWYIVNTGFFDTISRNIRDFKIQISKDTLSWVSIDSVTGNKANALGDSCKPSIGRYVRLYVTNSGVDDIARVHEFKVFGTAVPASLNGTFSFSDLSNLAHISVFKNKMVFTPRRGNRFDFLRIFSQSGRLLIKRNGSTNSIVVDRSALPTGLLLIELSIDKNVSTQKVVLRQ